VLLTGGTSRRLGVDKATLRLDGETLATRAAGLLSARCSSVIEVGPGHTTLSVVREDPAGGGPLAALVAGVAALREAAPAESVVLLACDLPGAAPALDALVAAPAAPLVVAVDREGRRQYVCARYGPEALGRAATMLAAGERSLRAVVESFAADDVIEVGGFASTVLADIDEPADARRAGIELHR
jgi:molybdopterin-guanine dinucleotide biosynthesis protein A